MNRPDRSRRLRLAGFLAVFSVFASLLGGMTASPATAADLSQFSPGNIVSDAVFFNSGTMSEDQISSFLQQKVPTCQSGYTCLKDFRQTTDTRAGDAYCSTYQGEANESSARIIAKVAQACGINPQVLLVTLQKEQGLVTHTWPSGFRYTSAMGQGCPDTAACDTRYYGFFNQMLGAARQFQVYSKSGYFTYYAPGKTWDILYNPNRSCGTSPVTVVNQATSNLYYYTPYQPNAASLRAGYGEGDGCSTYGNRNFYQYFTDWFGSTQSSFGPLVTGPDRKDVFLINNGVKSRVASAADLTALGSALGGLQTVPASYLAPIPTGPTVTRYVHDPRTGTLYLLEPDATKHRFPSAEKIAQFGYSFPTYVNLEPKLADAFRSGDEVADLLKPVDSDVVSLLQDNARRPIADRDAFLAATRTRSNYVATIDPTASGRIPAGPTYFAPNTLVRSGTDPAVYLTTPTATLLHIPSFALAAEFGAITSKVVDEGLLTRSTRISEPLKIAVKCGDTTYIAANGVLSPAPANAGGFATTALSSADCGGFALNGPTIAGAVFVQTPNSPAIYVAEKGTLRHVLTQADLVRLAAGNPLRILQWSAETAAAVGFGAPVLAEGSFVQFSGAAEIHRVESGKLRHVTSRDVLLRLGGGQIPEVTTVDSRFASAYPVGTPLTSAPAVKLAERSFVQFVGSTEVLVFKDAALHWVKDRDTLLRLNGGRFPTILSLPSGDRSSYPSGDAIGGGPAPADGSFVQFTDGPEVYRYSAWELHHVTSFDLLLRLGGGQVPPIASIPAEFRSAYPIGQPVQ